MSDLEAGASGDLARLCLACPRTQRYLARGLCDRCYYRYRRDGLELPPLRTRAAVPFRVRLQIASQGRGLNECWPWPGQLNPQGYPRGMTAGARSPQRASWELVNGPIPDGCLQLDHRCHSESDTCKGGVTCQHRRCINPAHLRLLTASENTRLRADRRGGTCLRGHPMTSEFGRRQSDGKWKCRPCHNLRRRENRARLRELAS